MKFALTISGLLLVSSTAFATSPILPSAPVADCSKASKGQVTVTTDGNMIDVAAAAKIAYSQCLVNTKSIGAARAKAVSKAKQEDDNSCGKSGELQTIETSSWIGERAYMSGNGRMINGGDSKLIVVDSITCGNMGTGMFYGTVAQVAVRLTENHTNSFNEADENDTKQSFVFTNATLVKLP